MKQIPADLDLDLLQGRQVEMVCFAAYSVDLHLDAGMTIHVEGRYLHHGQSDSDTASEIELPVAYSALPRLISSEILSAQADASANLTLRFSNGDLLRLLISDGPYESYQIKIGDNEFVI